MKLAVYVPCSLTDALRKPFCMLGSPTSLRCSLPLLQMCHPAAKPIPAQRHLLIRPFGGDFKLGADGRSAISQLPANCAVNFAAPSKSGQAHLPAWQPLPRGTPSVPWQWCLQMPPSMLTCRCSCLRFDNYSGLAGEASQVARGLATVHTCCQMMGLDLDTSKTGRKLFNAMGLRLNTHARELGGSLSFEARSRHTMHDLCGIEATLVGLGSTKLSRLDLARLAAIQSGACLCLSQHARFYHSLSGLCTVCQVLTTYATASLTSPDLGQFASRTLMQ